MFQNIINFLTLKQGPERLVESIYLLIIYMFIDIILSQIIFIVLKMNFSLISIIFSDFIFILLVSATLSYLNKQNRIIRIISGYLIISITLKIFIISLQFINIIFGTNIKYFAQFIVFIWYILAIDSLFSKGFDVPDFLGMVLFLFFTYISTIITHLPTLNIFN